MIASLVFGAGVSLLLGLGCAAVVFIVERVARVKP